MKHKRISPKTLFLFSLSLIMVGFVSPKNSQSRDYKEYRQDHAKGKRSKSSVHKTFNSPIKLKGEIITSSEVIDVPELESKLVQMLRRQDKSQIRKDENGQWVINFVAFFKRPLPAKYAGLVILDASGNPALVAKIPTNRWQKNLAGQIVVEETDTPSQPHTLQIYYAKGNRPVILAEKPIYLK